MAPHPNAMTHDLGLILQFRNMVPCLSKPQTLSVKISSSIEEFFFKNSTCPFYAQFYTHYEFTVINARPWRDSTTDKHE